MSRRRVASLTGATAVAAALLAACGPPGAVAHAKAGTVFAVGAENQYADVVAQVGGRWVTVSAVMSNPNTDPHTFEASPAVARTVAKAELVVQNGLGYDTFMDRLEAADPDRHRKVVDVQTLLRLPDSTPNPHLWYSPATMPAVARAVAGDLSALEPSHAGYFRARLARFDASLGPWRRAIAALKRAHAGAPVAVTEPVGDDLLQAAGLDVRTPFALQADIMNGVDPSPQAVSLEDRLLRDHLVDVFVYNRQVTDALTASFLAKAETAHVPVVGVYETMPTPGYDYQRWMLAETRALDRALTDHVSTTTLAR